MIIVHEGVYITSLIAAIVVLILTKIEQMKSFNLNKELRKLRIANYILSRENKPKSTEQSNLVPCQIHGDILPPWVKLDHKLINHGFIITWDRNSDCSKREQYNLYDPEGRLVHTSDLSGCKIIGESAIKDRLEFL